MHVIDNLFRYTRAKNYRKRTWFSKVIAKTKWCNFIETPCTFVCRLKGGPKLRKKCLGVVCSKSAGLFVGICKPAHRLKQFHCQ